MDYKKILIHSPDSFKRARLLSRQKQLGFNNLARMELFLWDLEIYLQVQSLLKDKVVLKGGAAVQFYIPVEYQRTSVDIDLICLVSGAEIAETVNIIENKFGDDADLFRFKLHKPKNPKTDLPLFTYHINVPSVCNDKELYKKQSGIQEIKVEFYISQTGFQINNIFSPVLFALETNKTYQILEINSLIGDKLTTLGPATIGISNERSDEQIKQIYDIYSLIQFNYRKIDFLKVKECFLERAKLECHHRKLNFNQKLIFGDVLSQLKSLSSIDFDRNQNLIKLINDFQGLYLRKGITRSLGEWANIGACLHLFINCFARDTCDVKDLILTFEISEKLQFNEVEGIKKGGIIMKFKQEFLKEFSKYTSISDRILQGKNPERIFWNVVSLKNINSINLWIDNFIASNKT